MAVTIDQVTALQFSATLLTLSQQKESKFASRVRQERVSSAEHAYFDTIDAYDAPSQKADRHGDTPLSEATFARRKVTPFTWEAGTLLDKYDMDRMLADPQGPVVQAHSMSLGRKKDDLVIAAMVGDATIGKNGGSTIAFEDESIGISGDAAGVKTVLGTAAVIGTIADIDLTKIPVTTVSTKLPKHVQDAFNRVAELDQLRSQLSAIRCLVEKAVEKNDPLFAELNVTKFSADVKNASVQLRAIRPEALCPYCTGDGYRTCLKRGWLGKHLYDHGVPSELKK